MVDPAMQVCQSFLPAAWLSPKDKIEFVAMTAVRVAELTDVLFVTSRPLRETRTAIYKMLCAA